MVRMRKLRMKPDFSHPTLSAYPIEPFLPKARIADMLARCPFDLRYLIEVLVSQNMVHIPELAGLLERLDQEESHLDKFRLLDALYVTSGKSLQQKLAGKFSAQRVRPHSRSLTSRSNIAIHIPHRLNAIPDHCVLVRRCLISPLRVILLPPQIETANSLLRDLTPNDCQDRLIRAQFVSEQGPLQMNQDLLRADAALDGEKGELARIRRTLDYGVTIAGRWYKFLMFGESQIKYVVSGFRRCSHSDGGFFFVTKRTGMLADCGKKP